ncbi:hypothetical protein NUW58_g3475 [Xylaria curta]|uniref:Uncharacterized protein n=1 Tax=Xylaria curta TaxID=42375 RepID=A0ACC1PBB8_9PEZI|nr:hypothetical protein NUW58_g3475 [Xylaria curta]
MPQSTPNRIVKRIQELGPQHLVTEGILREYCKKPTLVYITFWDSDSQEGIRPNPSPRQKYGEPSMHYLDGIVENSRTAFAPLLANKATKRWYESVRTPQPINARSRETLSLYPRCEARGTGEKPIDYHFLENFHMAHEMAALLDIRWVDDMLSREDDRQSGESHENADQSAQWWPNLIVRLEDIWRVTKNRGGPLSDLVGSEPYEILQIFGVLATRGIKLQDYLILLDGKGDDRRVRDEYRRLHGEQVYWDLMLPIKGYDAAEKLPTDITFASMEDFDKGERWIQARKVEFWVGMWERWCGPINAFFVRWKTANELMEEHETPGEAARLERRMADLLHRQPVRGFSENWQNYKSGKRK